MKDKYSKFKAHKKREEDSKRKVKKINEQGSLSPTKEDLSLKPKINSSNKEFLSKEDMELGIPSVPEAPKKKKKITLDSPDLTPDILERIKKVKSPNIKVVLVNCERCKAIIAVPIPKNAVLKSEIPVVPISYVHKNLQNKDQHCITIHIDHDFDIRRQRISDVVISSD
ncbi:MAG: hypothetical protein ACFFA6_14090 [Promethearchaeota archaeon]